MDHLGLILGHRGPSWAILSSSGGYLGFVLGDETSQIIDFPNVFQCFLRLAFFVSTSIILFHIGPSWPHLGQSWGHLGILLGLLKTFFGALKPFWAVLGPSRDVLEFHS